MELNKKLNKYLKLMEKALKEIKIKVPKKVKLKEVAEDFLDISKRYYEDAKYFKKKGDIVNAFSAVNYAHAFLDAGARLKVFDVHNSKLFMVDEK